MIAFSLIFIAAAISLYHLGLGDASLVYANIINLLARIIFGVLFARNFFGIKVAGNFKRVIPSFALLLVSVVMWGAMSYNGRVKNIEEIVRLEGRRSLLNSTVVQHVGLGSALAVVWLGHWWMTSGRRRNLHRGL